MSHRLRRSVRRAVLAVAVGVVLATVAAPASAATWRFETLDGNGTAAGRTTDSVGSHVASAVWNGTPHVWYRNGAAGDLRHAWWTGARWQFETLDGHSTANGRSTNDVGYTPAAIVWGGTPHVWYYDGTAGDLRHAWWTGAQWLFEVLDGQCVASCTNGRVSSDAGLYVSVTIWRNEPHIFYRDGGRRRLRHGWWNGFTWTREDLAGFYGGDDVGRFTAAVVFNGTPHVWYRNDTRQALEHGWWTGTRWSFEPLRTSGSGSGLFNTVLVWNGTPHVWYQTYNWAVDKLTLDHSFWPGGTASSWPDRTVDGYVWLSRRDVGSYPASAVWGGTPHVWYYDTTDKALRHAWWNAGGGVWQAEELDGASGTRGQISADVGRFNSVTIWNNQIHVWYHDATNGDLRHGWYS